MKEYLILIVVSILLVTFIGCEEVQKSVFDKIYEDARVTEHGVKQITYEEFMRIRNSEEDVVILDVLTSESFNKAHIPGAKSFPLDEINNSSVEKRINKEARVIVYCGGYSCQASTVAAKLLSNFGYRVLDYKGGLEEWQDMGNEFSSVQIND